MSRQRVRRSFTVEVKSSARQGSANDIPNRLAAAAEPAPRAPSWPWDAPPAPSPETPAPAAVAVERRRILPSLLPVEPPAAEPEPEPLVEPPLPRVRRVAVPATGEAAAPRKRGRPRKIASAEVPAATGSNLAEARIAVPVLAAIPEVPAPRTTPAGVASRARSGGRPEDQVLRRGERWKRRLPRSCW